MLIAKVVGSVVATQKDEKLTDRKFLVCQVHDHQNKPKEQYVVAIDVELLTLPAYVQQLRRLHPDVQIPFAAYDDGDQTSLRDLVNANLPSRPVFAVGQFKSNFPRCKAACTAPSCRPASI